MKEALAASTVVSPDETGWRIGGERAWLWVFATALMTVYHVARGRGFAQATEVLPAQFAGTLVRDGWVAYRGYTAAAHQSCLAHYVEAPVMWRRSRTADIAVVARRPEAEALHIILR